MYNINKTDHQKSIFSYNVYRTNNNQQRPHIRSTVNFKSTSLSSNLCKDPEVLFFNEKILRRSKRVVECSTQTSKTILQLAQNEQIVGDTKNGTYGVQIMSNVPFGSNVGSQSNNVNGPLIFCGPFNVPSVGPLNLSLNAVPGIPETGRMSPDSLSQSPKECTKNMSLENCPYSVTNHLSDYTLDGSCTEQDCLIQKSKFLEKPLTQTFLEKARTKEKGLKSGSFVDTYHHPNYIQEPVRKTQVSKPRITRRSCKSLELPDNSFPGKKSSSGCYSPQTFMCPTKASQIKSKMADIQSANYLIPPMRRGRSTSPKTCTDRTRFESSKKIPYIDQSKSDVSSSTTLINMTRNPEILRLEALEKDNSKSDISVKFSDDTLSLITSVDPSNSSIDNTISVAVNKLRESDWRIALRGLADVVEICRVVDVDLVHHYMTTINQKLIELLKSPRSHVCRTACQAAGHLFEYVKDTRGPEFDDIVDILLHKTADANRFIRHDANLALDCMVTHISTFNSVRALCSKGPFHKNSLVRCATARLLVCIIVIAGSDYILNTSNNELTRKRIILTMARLLEDKNLETRKLAERMYKVLCKDPRFDVYMKKYLEKDQIANIKRTLRLIHKK